MHKETVSPENATVPPRRFRVGRLLRDTGFNVVFGVIKAGMLLLVIRLASLHLPAAALGIFLLSRRFSATSSSFLQLGISQTLLRELPMSRDAAGKEGWLAFAGLLWFTVTILLIWPAIIAPRALTSLLYGSDQVSQSLTQWTVALTFASVLHFCAYSALFAERRIVAANTLELISGSILLLAVIGFRHDRLTVTALIGTQAVGMGLLSGWALAGLWYRSRAQIVVSREWGRMGRTLATYGLSRAMTPFMELLILSIGPWLIRGEAREAAALIIALSLLQMIQLVVVPLAQISSVVSAGLLSAGDHQRIQEGTRILLGSAIYGALMISCVVAPWAGVAVKIWLGKPDVAADVAKMFVTLISGILPLAVYYAVKGIIEVRWTRPSNLWTLLVACTTQVVGFVLLRGHFPTVTAVQGAITASFWVMGLMNLFWIRTDVADVRFWGLGRLLLVGACLLLINRSVFATLGPSAMAPAVIGSIALASVAFIIRPSGFARFAMEFVRARVMHG